MAKSEKTPPGNDQKLDQTIAWGLLLLTFFLYLQTFSFDFVNFDDPSFLTENRWVRAGLTLDSIRWALTTGYINWQPLVYLSHMAVVTAFGLDPAAHHLVNAFLHALNSAVFFLALRRFRLPLWPCAAAAAIFAFHPLRVESVAWVTERKDVLSALFWLLTMWAYARFAEQPKDRARFAWVAGFFVLGLMSKPILVTLPVALLILDIWPLNRWNSARMRDLIVEKAPLAILAGVAAVATIVTQEAAGAMAKVGDLSVAQRLANVVRSYAVYIALTLWPNRLAVLYPFPESWPVAEVVVSFLLLTGFSFWVWIHRDTDRKWLAAWLWYLIVLVPNIGFIQVGPQPYADRYTYLPFLLPLAAVAVALAARLGARNFQISAGLAAAILFAVSWTQIGTWRNDFTLYQHAIAVAPGAPLVYLNLGVALEKVGRYNDAITNYEIAERLNARNADAPLNIGKALLLSGRPAEAIRPITRSIQRDPNAPGPRYHLVAALIESGDLNEAAAEAQRAFALSPSAAIAASLHMQLGMIAYIRKDDQAALKEFNEAIRLDPENWPARKNAGIALGNMGRNREAIEQFQIYLKANPRDKDVAAAVAALGAAR